MILTCPDCATSYFVDDDRVPPQGRTVKCTSCGNRWRAMPEGAAEPVSDLRPVRSLSEPAAAAVVTPAPDGDLEIIARSGKRKAKRASGKAPPVGVMLGVALAVALAAAIGAAVLFRQLIVDASPASAPVFRAVGLKVDTLGLVIENVTSKAALQGGRPVLSITGEILNRYDTATQAPPIRISLIDRQGAVVAGLLAEPLNAKVPAGARRYFAVSMPDPPAGAHELEIAFDLTAKPAIHLAPDHAVPAHDTPEAVEAQALPASSPDALAPHEPR